MHWASQFKSQRMLCSKSITMIDCDTNTAVQVINILFTVLITCIYSTSTAIYYTLIIFCSRYPEDGVVIFFSEVLVNFYQSTRHHIPEHVYFPDTNQNLKSHTHFISLYIYNQQITNLLCCHNPSLCIWQQS